MLNSYDILFLESLVITIVVETAVLIGVVRKIFKIGRKKITYKYLFFAGFFCTFSTISYLWYLLPNMISDWVIYVIVGEFLVFLTESIMLFFILKLSIRQSLLASFLCNYISFVLGLIISLIRA
jgi:hypothetical protein